MVSSPTTLLLLLLHFPLLFLPSLASSNGTTVYDLLPEYGLPPGILPDTVKSYSLDSNGAFLVQLYGSCYVDFEYLVYYEPRVSGVVRYGAIENLKGVQVRRFYVWFDVDAIMVDPSYPELIYFQVGWITRKLRIDQFQTVHSCSDSLSLFGRAKEAARSILQEAVLAFGACCGLHEDYKPKVPKRSLSLGRRPPANNAESSLL